MVDWKKQENRSRSRWTHDEMDELIFDHLEAEAVETLGSRSGLSYETLVHGIIFRTARNPLTDFKYEERQLSRRLQWLAVHGFIYLSHGQWLIEDEGSIKLWLL